MKQTGRYPLPQQKGCEKCRLIVDAEQVVLGAASRCPPGISCRGSVVVAPCTPEAWRKLAGGKRRTARRHRTRVAFDIRPRRGRGQPSGTPPGCDIAAIMIRWRHARGACHRLISSTPPACRPSTMRMLNGSEYQKRAMPEGL